MIYYEYLMVGGMYIRIKEYMGIVILLKWLTCFVLCMEDNRIGGNLFL